MNQPRYQSIPQMGTVPLYTSRRSAARSHLSRPDLQETSLRLSSMADFMVDPSPKSQGMIINRSAFSSYHDSERSRTGVVIFPPSTTRPEFQHLAEDGPASSKTDYILLSTDDITPRDDPLLSTTRDDPVTTQDYPVTTRDDPVTTRDYPVTTQDYPATTQDYPVTTQDYILTTRDVPRVTSVRSGKSQFAVPPTLNSAFSTFELSSTQNKKPHQNRKVLSSAAILESKDFSKSVSNNGPEKQRAQEMIQDRIQLASQHDTDLVYLRQLEVDPRSTNIYSKGLPHDRQGYVNGTAMSTLIQALTTRNRSLLQKVELGNAGVRLLNPSAAWSNDVIGSCSNAYRYSKVPPLVSDKMAAQILELYAMALARDIPFSLYHRSDIVDDCCRAFRNLEGYSQSPAVYHNIFRGPMPGDLQGPYISQFLYRDIGVQPQKYATTLEGYNFMTTWEQAIAVQNGIVLEPLAPTREIPRYIITGRDLAFVVQHDEPYQIFYNTSVILSTLGVPMNIENEIEEFFVDFGKADIQSTLNLVGRNALLAAWYIKWNSLFLRPEAFGIEIERDRQDRKKKYSFSNNPILNAVKSRWGTALLPQAYPEGAPFHPSYPSGHAVIAGACVTVLKFFFQTNCELLVYEPDADGRKLVKTKKITTVGAELDKLASNIGAGRKWAGVNYHIDVIAGLKLGEKVALTCLQELVYRYTMPVRITIPRFNETMVTIANH